MDLSSRAPLTYLHGDPHLRNYYKTASGRVGLSDWQCTMKGAWSHDFAYAMLTSLPVENRRSWEKELLKFYLDRVRAKGGNAPTPEAAWELYRRQTLYTFVGWLVTIGFRSAAAEHATRLRGHWRSSVGQRSPSTISAAWRCSAADAAMDVVARPPRRES